MPASFERYFGLRQVLRYIYDVGTLNKYSLLIEAVIILTFAVNQQTFIAFIKLPGLLNEDKLPVSGFVPQPNLQWHKK